MKPYMMTRSGYVARIGEMRYSNEILFGKLEWKWLLRRCTSWWEY